MTRRGRCRVESRASFTRSRNAAEPLSYNPAAPFPPIALQSTNYFYYHHQPTVTMPPARARNTDSDGSGPAPAASNKNDKRRPAASHIPPPSLEKQASTGSVNANGAHAHEGIEGMGWDDIPLSVLHNYRHAYRLPVPSASSSYRGIVLSAGIGKRTPSAAGGSSPSSLRRRRLCARSSRDALATAVRKNFNAQPIQENEVIVNFLYTVKNQDKEFRLKFPPPPAK
ncbi:hypothetical protein FN846DRAFT_977424 [Sphaerosporella brunnea]|uniref:Histone deacetylase complex subunit SAP30 Sin3 binding domain-containing protein n=1 Tax=Sphaerosporella brunnea TaxID=1250544 RepID=A0A5J5EEK7_9PEZI|nr:hypothetical protein FN846DRAFT_977424 [Sphaerosporella brunnea]